MKIVSLISSVNQNIDELIKMIKLETDAVLVNQCDHSEAGSLDINGSHIEYRCMPDRGVGLSRNTCIDMAIESADILLFTDEDITYDPGYASLIENEFVKHPDAQMLFFNIRVCDARRTYWNKNYARVGAFNYGRYPAYSIAIRADILKKSGVRFSLDFGGGAKYANGEDSIFIHDLLKSRIKMYRTTVCLGQEKERESTWFEGYNDRFFISRGALYVKLYGSFALFRAYVFLFRHQYMYAECGLKRAIELMKLGMKEIRSTK